MHRPLIFGFSGSLREQSSNTQILRTLADAVADRADVRVQSLARVPLYNADLEGDLRPQSVIALREMVEQADGLILSSPEYNYGVSGVLKNAVDWLSRPGYASPLKNKPVLIMTASPAATGGVRAQQQMRDMLAACLCRPIARPEVVVPFVYEKLKDGRLVDEATLTFAVAAIDDLLAEIRLLQQ